MTGRKFKQDNEFFFILFLSFVFFSLFTFFFKALNFTRYCYTCYTWYRICTTILLFIRLYLPDMCYRLVAYDVEYEWSNMSAFVVKEPSYTSKYAFSTQVLYIKRRAIIVRISMYVCSLRTCCRQWLLSCQFEQFTIKNLFSMHSNKLRLYVQS